MDDLNNAKNVISPRIKVGEFPNHHVRHGEFVISTEILVGIINEHPQLAVIFKTKPLLLNQRLFNRASLYQRVGICISQVRHKNNGYMLSRHFHRRTAQ
jgi:hypothetical protein